MKIRKILLPVFTISLILMLSLPHARKAEASEEYNVQINGHPVKFTMAPVTIQGNLSLPLREIYEIFGFNVQWDDTAKTALCTKADKNILIKPGSETVHINRKILTLPVPATIINGRIYVTSQVICEGLDTDVNIDEEEKNIYFATKNQSNVSVSGNNNFLVAGNNVIVSVVKKYDNGEYGEEIQAADSLIKDNNYWGAIKSYEKILKNISSEKNPEEYAHVMNNMANTYIKLSCLINKEENVLKAISIFQEVLDKIEADKYSSYIADAYKGIGNAYGIYANVRNMEINLSKSLSAMDEALKLYDKEKDAYDYAYTQIFKAYSHYTLSHVKEPVINLVQGLKSCDEALGIFTFEKTPREYSDAKEIQGVIYLRIFLSSNKTEDLYTSLKSFQDALKMRRCQRPA